MKADEGHIAQCFLGICLLVGLFLAGLAAGNSLIFVTFGLALPLGLLIANLSFWIPAILLFFLAGRDAHKTGWALAPLVFIGVWFVASIFARLVVSLQATGFATATTDPTLSQIKTLIVEEPVSEKIIADGFVDRVITVSYSDSEKTKVKEIVEKTLARGNLCSETDHKASWLLNRAGRTDECFKSSLQGHIGDGLFISRSFMRWQNRGCCNVISASVRRNNTIKLKMEWQQGFAWVPSYVPMAGFLEGKTPPVWGVGGGPVVRVRFGAPDITVETMVSAIYGVDLNSPAAIAKVRGEELARRAAALDALETPSTGGQAVSVALLALDAGYVDENTIRIMAKSLIFVPPVRPKRDVRYFFRTISPENKQRFKEELLRLLTAKPSPCDWCKPDFMGFLRDEAIANRAVSLFSEHSELTYSQYRGLLDIADIKKDSTRRKNVFTSIVEGSDRVISLKLTAFLNETLSLSSDEMRSVSEQFDRMTDDEFAEFGERATQIAPFLEMRGDTVVWDGETYLAYCASALERAERIKAPELRRKAIDVATKRLNWANRKFKAEADGPFRVQ